MVPDLEPVAHAWFGDEVAGVRRIGFQLAADLGDEDAQVVGFLLVLGPPDLLQQLPLADQPAGVAHQQLDQLPLGGGQADLSVVSGDLLGGQVDTEVRGVDDRSPLVGWGGPPDGGPEAGLQLVPAAACLYGETPARSGRPRPGSVKRIRPSKMASRPASGPSLKTLTPEPSTCRRQRLRQVLELAIAITSGGTLDQFF